MRFISSRVLDRRMVYSYRACILCYNRI